MEHYLLSAFALLTRGEKEIVLESRGSQNAKAIDLANLIANRIFPGEFKIEYRITQTQSNEEDHFLLSCLSVSLKVK